MELEGKLSQLQKKYPIEDLKNETKKKFKDDMENEIPRLSIYIREMESNNRIFPNLLIRRLMRVKT